MKKRNPFVLQGFFLIIAGIILLGGLSSAWAKDLKVKKNVNSSSFASKWLVAPGFNGGYNKMLEGWDGYDDLGTAGFDLYIRYKKNPIPTKWTENFLFRFNFDYMPLQVPDGLFGVEEDIFAYTGSVIYQLHSTDRGTLASWIPFLGFGGGFYQDRVTVDTPATGEISGSHTHFGFNGSIGLFMPIIDLGLSFRLVPEIRYHSINTTGGKATNVTYQGSLVFWPSPHND